MDVIGKFLALVNGFKMSTLGILIVLDVLTGIILAIKMGTFSLQKLPSYLETDVLCKVGGYLIVGVMAVAEPRIVPAVAVSFAAISISLASSVLEKLKKIGLPVPEMLTR